MEDKNFWTYKCDELCFEFIRINLENNSYYEQLRKAYKKDKETTIRAIFKCYENFSNYYSLYTIMDSMEDFLAEHKKVKIYDVAENEDFEIKE